MKHNQIYSRWHSAAQFSLLALLRHFGTFLTTAPLDFANQRWMENAILALEDVEDGD
jgi:hypothetical protein